MLEVETKFKVRDEKLLLARLKQIKAVGLGGCREVDFSCDTPKLALGRQGKLLRLRRAGTSCMLTFKGPVLASRFKKRVEINLACDNFKNASRLLIALGFLPRFAKEKKRRQWRYRRALICMDTLPCIGTYVEIEGRPKDIVAAARVLGLDPASAIKQSYESLFALFCMLRAKKAPAVFKKAECSFSFQRVLKTRGLL